MRFFYIVFCFLLICACDDQNHDVVTRIENNTRNDVIENLLNSLDLKTKKAVNACVSNWKEAKSKRENFWALIGSLNSYENYAILEFGNTENILYKGLFLGKKSNKWHVYSSIKSGFSSSSDVRLEHFFGNVDELKGYSFNETMWPTSCKILSIKSGNIEREIVSFSMLNLLNYEKFNALDFGISELDHLMIKLEYFFELNNNG